MPEHDDASARPSLRYPVIPVDGLLRRAAQRWPARVAVRTATAAVTFAELDGAADRAAAAVVELVGGTGRRCAIATELSPLFASAFYGIVRGGNVAVTLNPLHRPEAVARAIVASGASAAVVSTDLLDRLAPMAANLPPLVTLDDLAAMAPSGVADAGGDRSADVACLHFTSGTTGEPKGVLLTHRNLVVNAMQTVQAHRLDTGSVAFNGLPAYHLMHLNAGVYAGATQWLYGAPALTAGATVTDSLADADRVGATHYYTLPMLLARLAAAPDLDRIQLRGVRGMYCGGSALPAPVAQRLSTRFAIPVVQGFGLAEASSMTHLDRPESPTVGSAGVPAADTECRVVDVETRVPLPVGGVGEIQVRGPQLMAGYLDGSTGLDADGWLSTGDVGRVDADRRLFLVDRLKDVFKCDNELVSPSELERVVAGHPAVRDCAVVDRPDRWRGAVPVALLVLDGSTVDPDDVLAHANERLAPFQRIVSARVVDAIPRTPIGKIARRGLREQVAAGAPT